MTPQDYILRQIAKTNKKNYENYVVTRVWHRLDRADLKMVTQQYVRRPEGHALTDIYFPQLKLHIEVDELHHRNQIVLDIKRDRDIVEATDHDILRIEITTDMNEFNSRIDDAINEIKNRIHSLEDQDQFEPWSLDREFDPNFWRTKGILDIKDNPAFRRIVDACNCLGQNYKNAQRAFYRSKVYPDHYLWFPKFYENNDWDNSISDDGKTIIERCKNTTIRESWFPREINNTALRIVFAHSIDNLGFVLYRFKGVFKTDFGASSLREGIIHRRITSQFSI